jgi:hypothetical protein
MAIVSKQRAEKARALWREVFTESSRPVGELQSP